MNKTKDDCREMPTRTCPTSSCVDLPCARFESDDESRWDLDRPEQDAKFKLLVLVLQARLGRQPSVDEVMRFIQGSEEERQAIWNSSNL